MNKEMLEAIHLAMEAELEASSFYAKAAEQTRNPRGRDMFSQLADFEKKHYKNLKQLVEAGREGGFAGYQGTEFGQVNLEAPSVKLSPEEIRSDIDAINMAVSIAKKRRIDFLDFKTTLGIRA